MGYEYDEMLGPVDPVVGADEVVFPWDTAYTAVTAMRDLADDLDMYAGRREGMAADDPGLDEWTGPYKDDFVEMWDEWYDLFADPSVGLAEVLRQAADDICQAASDARALQEERNDNQLMSPPDSERNVVERLGTESD